MTDGEQVTLEKYLVALMDERDRGYRQRFEAQEKAVEAALAAASKATDAALAAADRLAKKAEEFADEKLKSHNQIRPWVQGMVDALDKRIILNEKRTARFEDREAGIGLSAKVIVGAVSLLAAVLAIIGWFMLHR